MDKVHIVKSNNLIEGGYKLTLMEQRLINLACKKLRPIFISKNISLNELHRQAELNSFEDIEITVPEFRKEFDIVSNNIYKELTKTVDSLFNKEIVIYSNNEVTRKRWVITCTYSKSTKKVIIRFHPDLITDLLIFKSQYTKLDYKFLTTTKNSHTTRIYELMRQYLLIGTREISIEDLRFKLGLLNGEYPAYSNLNQKILKPAIEWINSNSDIQVDYTEIKNGRKIVAIVFKINNNELNKIKQVAKPTEESMENVENNKILENILGISLTPHESNKIYDYAIQALKTHNLQDTKLLNYISTKWNIVSKYTENKPDYNKIGALLIALKENWTTLSSSGNKPQLKFNNFNGREYTQEEWIELERRLLGWE